MVRGRAVHGLLHGPSQAATVPFDPPSNPDIRLKYS